MRFLVKVEIPVEMGNQTIKDGTLPKKMQSILAELKPEAAYFTTLNGKRTALLFLDMQNPSQMVSVAEPFFLGFGASVEIIPAMSPDDLMKGGPAMEAAVKKYS